MHNQLIVHFIASSFYTLLLALLLSLPWRSTSTTPIPGMTVPADTTHRMSGMDIGGMTMSYAYSRNRPMNRNGSGTAWQPGQTPLYMWMQHKGP